MPLISSTKKDDVVNEVWQMLEQGLSVLASRWNSDADKLLHVSVLSYAPEKNARRMYKRRLLINTNFWALSLRQTDNSIELFSLPANHIAALVEEELLTRLKFKLQIQRKGTQFQCLMDSAALDDKELNLLVRTGFKELTSRSLQEAATLNGLSTLELHDEVSLMGKLKALISDKHHFASKLVLQQEALHSEISRNIHDGAIGRLMVLKSALASKTPANSDIILATIDEVVDSLRDTCANLCPRDLRDWGLAVVVQDLVQNMGKRTGIDCDVAISETLPQLAPEVELNVFRIIQESLTNCEKHAGADTVRVSINYEDSCLSVRISDDGRGLPELASKGMGMSIMRERLELIRATQGATLKIGPGLQRGTSVELVLKCSTITSSLS
jgi:signal transduction histidine kinase